MSVREKFWGSVEYLLTYIPNIHTAETVIATYFRALRMAMLGLKINARFGAKLPGKQNVSSLQDFKGEKTNSSYPSQGRLGVILILTPTAALLVQAATSYPSETLHIWLLLHLLSQEGQHTFHHRR